MKLTIETREATLARQVIGIGRLLSHPSTQNVQFSQTLRKNIQKEVTKTLKPAASAIHRWVIKLPYAGE